MCKSFKMECGSRLVLLDFFLVMIALITHLTDSVISCLTVYRNLNVMNNIVAAVTVLLTFTPGVITSILSCIWLTKGTSQSVKPKLPTVFHVFRILSIVFLNSPISGYVNALYYLFKRHEALRKGELEALQRSWEVMTACMTEVTSLRLYFAFLNVTPHLVLQLYFLLQLQTKVNFPEGWVLEVSIAASSLVSITIAVTTYDRAFRQSQPNKEAFRARTTIVLFFSHLFHLSARLLALSLFATLNAKYVCFILGTHWAVMVIWLMLPLLKSSFHLKKILSILAIGTAYIFVFINSEGTRTQRKYAFYYTISLVGNTAMMVMWFKYGAYSSLSDQYWVYFLFLTVHYIFFLIGILLLIVNHIRCNPERVQDTETISGDIRLNTFIRR